MNRFPAPVLVAIMSVTSACSSGYVTPSSPSPNARTSVTPSAPLPPGTISVRGSISDTAFRWLKAARIEVLDGPHAGLVATSNDLGEFTLIGVFDDSTRFQASKDGHVTATRTLLFCERCVPQRSLHFYMDVSDEPVVLTGNYDLTFAVEGACPGFPPELRERTFRATIPDGARRVFDVVVSGAPFAVDEFIYAGVAGNYLALWMEGFTEQLSPNQFLIWHFVPAATTESSPRRIEASGAGRVTYCQLPQASGSMNECHTVATAIKNSCDSHNHRLIFNRR